MEPVNNRSYITVKKNPFDKIILGDMNKCILHDAVTRTQKGKEPTVTKKIRSLLMRAGYETYLLDE